MKVWELVEDTDFPNHDRFRIDRKSGVLTFKSTPDYENPRSSITAGTLADRNVYKVKAKLGDGEKFVYTEVTVRVTGVEEAEILTLSARQPEVGVKLTATLAGGDIRGLRTPDWQWQVENDSGGFDNITDAVNRSYTPRAVDEGKKLRAYVSYQDSHDDDVTKLGDGDQFILGTGVSEFTVRASHASNNVAPMFRENDKDNDATNGVQTSRRIEENSAPGMKVGPPVFATDNNHLAWNDADDPGGPRDVLTYSLEDLPTTGADVDPNEATYSGNAALFAIDQTTGQIMTKAPLDYESLNRTGDATDYMYRFLAIATDPSGATGMVTVTIHVLDVDEAPEITGPAALTYFENSIALDAITAELRLDRIPDDEDTSEADFDPAVYMAADNDLDDDTAVAVGNIQWQLTGPDAAKFQFEGSTATYTDSDSDMDALTQPVIAEGTPAELRSPALQFRSPPDLENATDVGGTPGDNVYEITLVAWDVDWEIGSRDVTIRVANSDDTGTITLSHIKPQVGTKIKATLNDPDGVSQRITWQWYRGSSATAGNEADGPGAKTDTYTPIVPASSEP